MSSAWGANPEEVVSTSMNFLGLSNAGTGGQDEVVDAWGPSAGGGFVWPSKYDFDYFVIGKEKLRFFTPRRWLRRSRLGEGGGRVQVPTGWRDQGRAG